MRIVLLGAGNLATHLSIALQGAGQQIVQVFSKTANSASTLAHKLNVPYTIDADELIQDADIYFYAVSDDALESLLDMDLAPEAIHVHTAGSIAMDIFKSNKVHHGVFYPLQTFSKTKAVDFNQIPIFLESSDMEVERVLNTLAYAVSKNVYETNSDQRMKLHLAAVYACNYVNHLYHIASDIVASIDLPFDVLKPLIIETADKINYLSPADAQTGPAKRNDISVINKHLELLDKSADLSKLYSMLSQMILDKNLHQS